VYFWYANKCKRNRKDETEKNRLNHNKYGCDRFKFVQIPNGAIVAQRFQKPTVKGASPFLEKTKINMTWLLNIFQKLEWWEQILQDPVHTEARIPKPKPKPAPKFIRFGPGLVNGRWVWGIHPTGFPPLSWPNKKVDKKVDKKVAKKVDKKVDKKVNKKKLPLHRHGKYRLPRREWWKKRLEHRHRLKRYPKPPAPKEWPFRVIIWKLWLWINSFSWIVWVIAIVLLLGLVGKIVNFYLLAVRRGAPFRSVRSFGQRVILFFKIFIYELKSGYRVDTQTLRADLKRSADPDSARLRLLANKLITFLCFVAIILSLYFIFFYH
jgi:hypothetical protein